MEIIEKTLSFIKNRTSLFYGICLGLVVLLILLIILLVMLNSVEEKKERTKIGLNELYLSSEPFFYPDVFVDRKPKEHWTDKDFEKWFSPLSEEEAKMLESTFYDEMNRILEAVP